MPSAFLSRVVLACSGLIMVSCCGLYPRHVDTPLQSEQRKQRIAKQLLEEIPPGISSSEAQRISNILVDTSERLAQSYKLVAPSWYHNILVNRKLKPRGLCYQHADDLQRELVKHRFKSLYVVQGVRCRNNWQGWRRCLEHHCLVIIPKGYAFSDGMVVDSWKDSGNLLAHPVRGAEHIWIPFPFEYADKPD